MPFLIFEKDSENQAIEVDLSAPFKIGRSMENHLRLREDSLISRFHSLITYSQDQNKYFLHDLGSSNGTFLNDICLEDQKSEINNMDQITIGNIAFVFVISDTIQYTISDTTTIMINSPTPDISAPEPLLMSETSRLEKIKPVPSKNNKFLQKEEDESDYPEIDGFEIINILDDGTTTHSTTYLAFQSNLKRSAIIKVFKTKHLTEPEKEDFFKNVRLAGKLQHPNIISYIDTGSNDRYCYLSMQYAEDGNLAQQINASPFSEKKAIEYMIQIIDAMIHASEANIIHYNITPQNILINKSGKPAVSDFGLAEWISSSFQVNRNYFFGSTKYMPPEQMLDKALDWTCDQYALGAIFYEMLTGKPPFDAPSIYALIEKHVREKVRFPSTIKLSKNSQNIILKMMQKRSSDRFSSWQEILSALKNESINKSRKNIPLKAKKMKNITKQKNSIQIPIKKKKIKLR